ncbi:Peptidoglycan-binding lysin domain-containing protein [Actinobacteria bacterium OV450]|nr:Peptidoglycan-binding lysin domain-containing protein [Actinobacteria bacterium OV450]
MEFIPREAWGAPAESPAGFLPSARGIKIHYLGTEYTSRLHARCAEYVRQIRAAHLADVKENYVDIAYSGLVCEHGAVFEGRGTHKRPGANGSRELNSQDYAICALLAKDGGGLDTPPRLMLHGLRDAIEWLRRDGDAGSWLGGHRDGYATDCPGDRLYAWVQEGAPRPDHGQDDGPGPAGVYTVQVGDSLSVVARRLNVSWQDLAEVNGIRAPYTIYPGQRLRIPQAHGPVEVPPFPGRSAFVLGKAHPAVLLLDDRLIAGGWTRHHDGNGYQRGPRFTEYTRRNVADFQRSRPELRADPDGYPGPVTWELLYS